MRTDYISTDTLSHLLWALQPANKLIIEVCLNTGWRIDDVLNLKTQDIIKALSLSRPTLYIVEKKTGKTSRKYIPKSLLEKLFDQSGRIYVFEGRDDYRKHRTRQAVFLDIKRVSKKFNIKINLAPHSFRKNYAVYLKQQGKSLNEIQKALNHDNIAVTMLYAMADELQEKYS